MNHYLALLSRSGRPTTHDQALDQQILYFLDDRHLPVQVSYDDRLPEWVRTRPLLANVVYLFRLLAAPASTVLADYALHDRAALALALVRVLTRHRLVMLVRDAQLDAAVPAARRAKRLTAALCLRAAHDIVVHSQRAWMKLIHHRPWEGKVRFLPWPLPRKRAQQPGHGQSGRLRPWDTLVPAHRRVRLRRWKPFEFFLYANRQSR